jgi:hypothetical protein
VQEFEELRKLIEYYKLDTLAQSFFPEREIPFKIQNKEVNQIFEEFLVLAKDFLKRKDYFAQKKGTLEWLGWIYSALDLEKKMFVIVGEKTKDMYEEELAWIIGFGINAMLEMILRVQQWIRRETSLFKGSRLDHESLRQEVICTLANLSFSLFYILFNIIRIEKREMEPSELYDIVSTCLHRMKHME